MTILSPKRNFKKDLEKVRLLSSKIEKKINSDHPKIDRLTPEQLQDLSEILHLADYLLTKYEDKKDFHELLKEFVNMINSSARSIEDIDDDIEELVLSAEESISHIRAIQARVAAKVDFDMPHKPQNRPNQV